jgi:hypothetical protein
MTASEWPYLQTEEARARYVLAAHYLRDCPVVVEIGGYLTPIQGFLGGATREVFGIDPKVAAQDRRDGDDPPRRIRMLRARFQDVDLPFAPGSYGLSLIGCSLKFDKEDAADKRRALEKLVSWAAGAHVTVLEYAADWENGREVRALLDGVAGLVPRVALELVIPVRPPDLPEFGRRAFVVYERG